MKRMREHKAVVRRGDDNNGVAVHAWKQQHRMDWEEAKIIEQEQHYTSWNNRLGVGLRLGNNRGTIENNREECFYLQLSNT